MNLKQVVVLEVAFKLNLEDLGNELQRIKRAMGPRVHWPVSHAAKSLQFVVVTTDTPERLAERIRPRLTEIHAVDNFWCYMAPRVVYGMNGALDPFQSRIGEAWHMAAELNYPNNLKQA